MPHGFRALCSTLLSAVAVALAFPPWRMWWLAWVGLAPFFVAIVRVRSGVAALLAALWLVTFAAVGGTWLPHAVSTYYAQPAVVGLAVFVLVTGTMGAPYTMAFAAAYRRLARRSRWTAPWLVAAAWTAVELARGRLFTGSPVFIGNPWGLLGYSQVDREALTQIAAATGVYGITFVVAAVNAAIAELWAGNRSLGVVMAGVAPAAFALAFGLSTLDTATEQPVQLPIAVVQGNLALGSTWRPELYGRNLDVYLDETRAVLDPQRPRVVFWPEAAMSFFLEQDDAYRATVAAVLASYDTQLVAGGPSGPTPDTGGYHNSVFVLDPDGMITARYDKEYLVPFAEYFPLGGIDVLRRRFGRVRVFEPGVRTAPVATRVGRAGIVICNEAMLPEVVAQRVADGAEYLVNPANDSWIADAQYAAQQLDIVRLRAVEQRRWLVRVSTAGPSAVIDPWGRIVTRTPALTRATTATTIAARGDRTIYGRVGDAFGGACGVTVAIALWRRRRSAP